MRQERTTPLRARILVDAQPNARWSLDFVHDQPDYGCRFWILSMVDDVTRECMCAIPDVPVSGWCVARELNRIVQCSQLAATCEAQLHGSCNILNLLLEPASVM